MISLGVKATARAIATRWRWPPENSRGSLLAASRGRPTLSNSSVTLEDAALNETRWARKGSASMEPIVIVGSKEL